MAQEGSSKAGECLFENKVGKKRLALTFGRILTRPEGPSMTNFTPVCKALAEPPNMKTHLSIILKVLSG